METKLPTTCSYSYCQYYNVQTSIGNKILQKTYPFLWDIMLGSNTKRIIDVRRALARKVSCMRIIFNFYMCSIRLFSILYLWINIWISFFWREARWKRSERSLAERPCFVCMYKFSIPMTIFERQTVFGRTVLRHYLEAIVFERTLFERNSIWTRSYSEPRLFFYPTFFFSPTFYYPIIFTPTFFLNPTFF